MSRIHDALRKAELEGPAVSDAGPARQPGQINESGSGQHNDAPAPDAVRAASPEDTLRTIREKCPQHPWDPDRNTMLLFDRRKPGAGLEQFRTLRSQLDLIRRQRPLRKVLITSPLPEEGKTFVAANLAQVIVRQPEKHVLLIDGDLRKPHLHAALGASSKPGLADYLEGNVDEFGIIQRGPVENLFLIPGGQASNPSELIGNGRLKLLLDQLTPVFDWIIIDSPAVIPVADARLLAGFCDGVLMVVRAGSTPFDLAQRACQQFPEESRLGVVVDRAEEGAIYRSAYQQDHEPRASRLTK